MHIPRDVPFFRLSIQPTITGGLSQKGTQNGHGMGHRRHIYICTKNIRYAEHSVCCAFLVFTSTGWANRRA